jgi:hypothetical protein
MQSFTVVATVTMVGHSLALLVIISGKTRGTMLSRGDVGVHAADFSLKGWQRLETYVRYLRWLRSLPRHQHGRTLHLVSGCYRVQRCAAGREAARDLNIQLRFVPAGLTDMVQPLDRDVFGTLKSIYHRMYREGINSGVFQRVGKKDFVTLPIAAWDLVPEAAMPKAWAHFREE